MQSNRPAGSARCTIIINTHNNPRYLERSCRWFLECPFPIIIADSSKGAWEPDLRARPELRYIHHPHKLGGPDVFFAKISAALHAVDTPYVAICDDDDFLLPEGVARSAAFLDAHADYSFCAGYTYQFQPFRRRVVIWPLPHNHDVSAESWLERAGAAAIADNGVIRTEVLRAYYDFMARQDFSDDPLVSLGFIDFSLTSYVARCGKLRREPVAYHLREYGGAPVTLGSRPLVITSHMVPDFFRNLVDFLAGEDKSEGVRAALMRLIARYWAWVLLYDLSPKRSRRRFVGRLPAALIWRCEYLFRLLQAARGYAAPGRLGFLRVFSSPDYRKFRLYAVMRGDRPRP